MTQLFKLRSEWAPQSAILFAWPHPETDFAADLTQVDKVYVEMVTSVAKEQRAIILYNDDLHKQHIRKQLSAHPAQSNIDFVQVTTDDIWIRDYGSLSLEQVSNKTSHWLLCKFNGWGQKYPHLNDQRAMQAIIEQSILLDSLNIRSIFKTQFVLEGGSIETDGLGTVLTTEDCLLNKNRNPAHTKSDIEVSLKRLLGAERVLWLKSGFLLGDDTDSHIDQLARFCNENTICYTACNDSEDSHFEALSWMFNELKTFKSAKGEPYNLVALPIPKPIFNSEGDRLPASYANFLITNKCVLLPTYNDPQDGHAISALARLFPSREIVPINAIPLIHQRGSIHCATMQIAS